MSCFNHFVRETSLETFVWSCTESLGTFGFTVLVPYESLAIGLTAFGSSHTLLQFLASPSMTQIAVYICYVLTLGIFLEH